MKQSSIEWFFEQLEFNDSVSRYELLEQAKQMHEQEVIESYVEGADTGEMFNNENRVFTTDAKEYYNETFKSE